MPNIPPGQHAPDSQPVQSGLQLGQHDRAPVGFGLVKD
jgi:hypothetical protein